MKSTVVLMKRLSITVDYWLVSCDTIVHGYHPVRIFKEVKQLFPGFYVHLTLCECYLLRTKNKAFAKILCPSYISFYGDVTKNKKKRFCQGFMSILHCLNVNYWELTRKRTFSGVLCPSDMVWMWTSETWKKEKKTYFSPAASSERQPSSTLPFDSGFGSVKLSALNFHLWA